jgi:DNA-binding CsgD family transcriptional regulator
MIAAGFAGRFAAPGGSLLDVARQVSAASGPAPTAFGLLLDGLAANYVRGYTASLPILRGALSAFRDDMPAGQELRGIPLALLVSTRLWDDDACEVISEQWAGSAAKRGRSATFLPLSTGKWLRRQRRPGEARDQLHTALDMLEAMGMEGFSERARRELRATGETRARKRTVSMSFTELTAQEAQVAKLAREGLSNPEIGARLYISSRTAEYHLSKVFTKLNITSRIRLEQVPT